ncbi:MAG TPA: alpha/beta hydrolase [Allosphingosinicella sp.]|nr:alpha/beta hydrolase [Allosphingosinicella sp.]
MSFWLAAALAAAPIPALQTLDLYDSARQRAVPVTLYGATPRHPRPLALLSHGYGMTSDSYGFLARALVARGYVVAAITHDLPGDAAIPSQGEPRIVRRPFWERGEANLAFAVAELRARRIARRGGRILVVGHSNGGDISALFAERHPDMVAALFTLDNRRMPLPRTARPRICSARSSDQPADPEVLPSSAEQARLGMVIAPAPVIHNDMWDGATEAQKAAILAVLDRCLQRRER